MQVVLLRRVQRDVRSQAGLSHAGAASDDDEIRFLQAAQNRVQVGEAGGNAQQLILVLLQVLDAVNDLFHCPLDGHEVPPVALLGDAEDLLFGLVHDVISAFAPFVGQRSDAACGGDQSSQDRSALHNVGVVLHVDGGRHGIDERGDVRGATHLVQLLTPSQLIAEGDEVNRLAAFVQVQRGLIDPAMLLAVEVCGFQ